MWILLNDSFLSIVTDTTSSIRPPELLVRARVAGDIESVFPHAQVRENNRWDYRYRATVSREEVAEAIAERVRGIDYPNFKSSVEDERRHDALLRIWAILRELQE